MHVAVITHVVAPGDGQGRVNYEIVCELLRRSYEVTLLCTRVAENLLAEENLHWVPVRPRWNKVALIKNRSFSGLAEAALRQSRDQFDAVLVNGATVRHAAHEVNAVHFVHDAWQRSPYHTVRTTPGPYGWYQWLYSALNSRWEAGALKAATRVVAVSMQVRDDLVAAGVPVNRIKVIHNGVDLSEFYPGSGSRTDFGLPAQVTMALFVGDIRTPRKNLDTVLRALVEVPTLHLAVAGNVEGSPFPALSKRLRIEERVHFVGFRKEIGELMRAADFLVFPSRYDPCGLVLLEAMGAGLPVITAVTTGGASLVDGEAGIILADPEDVSALADAMQSLAEDPARCRHMGRAARGLAEHYTFERTASAYADLIEEVADTGGKPAGMREVSGGQR